MDRQLTTEEKESADKIVWHYEQAEAKANDAKAAVKEVILHCWDAGILVAHWMDRTSLSRVALMTGLPTDKLKRLLGVHRKYNRDEIVGQLQLPLDDPPTPLPDQRSYTLHAVVPWISPLNKAKDGLYKFLEDRPIASWSRPELEDARAELMPLADAWEKITARLEKLG